MYQQDFRNRMALNNNFQNFSISGFRNVTPTRLNSSHQNQVHQHYRYVAHGPLSVPAEHKNNNSYQMQPPQSGMMSPMVRSIGYPPGNDVVQNFNRTSSAFQSGNAIAYPDNVHQYSGSVHSFEATASTSYKTAENALIPKTARQNFQNKISQYAIDTKSDNENVNSKRHENEKIRILTGTAEKIIKWHKIYNDYFCFYEIVASIVSIQEGTVRLQKIMLLRDKKGPIIQIIHYVNDHIKIENFFVGQMLRCVGRMVGPNIMHGLSIREATDDEVAALQRMSYISDHAISKALKKF